MLSCTSSLRVVKIEAKRVFILGAGAINLCSIKTNLVQNKNKSLLSPLNVCIMYLTMSWKGSFSV